MGDEKSHQSSKSTDDSESDEDKNSKDDDSNESELSGKVKTSDEEAESSNTLEERRLAFLRKLSESSNSSRRRWRQTFFAYKARQRPRQPFMTQDDLNQVRGVPASAPPRPPPYYVSQVTPEQHRPDIIRATSEVRNPNRSEVVGQPSLQSQQQSQPPTTPPSSQVRQSNQSASSQSRQLQIGGTQIISSNMPQPGMGMIANPLFNFAYWAPYPDSVPATVLPCLAHLYQADSLFIVQQINVLELLMWSYINVPNFYLIQNKNGHVIYYVYETTDLCMTTCCSGKRGFQLHVMDIYNNEVIYMNRPCGCSNFPCCYPVMEVYSPPLVPVGAILQVFNPRKHEFTIIDADENIIFKIYGPCCFNCCGCCVEVDFTIHATDKDETEVGIIRREWGGYVRTLLADSDLFGITFPKDLDVRVKAIFLGALFFIEYLYFEG